MAVNVTDRGSVGCAYYVAQEQKLYFMEDVELGGPDIVESLVLFVDPATLLVSTKCQGETMDRLDPDMRNPRAGVDGRNTESSRFTYRLECRPNVEFSYEAARNKMANLQIGQQHGAIITYTVPGDVISCDIDPDNPDGTATCAQGQLLRLAGWVDMEARLTVGCAGAVLAYLQRRRATAYLPGDRDAGRMFQVKYVEMFTLRGSMFVNPDTTISLQITTTESHPNAQQQGPASRNWSGGHKEGLSVYGLFFNLAKTQQGRLLLRKYFLRPSLDIKVIEERLNTISVLLRTDNANVFDRITATLSKVKNMRTTVAYLRKGITSMLNKARGSSIGVWLSLRQFLLAANAIVDLLHELQGGERLMICGKTAERFDRRRLAQIGQHINDTIDFDVDKDARHCIIKPGVDEALDEAQRTYDAMEPMLSQMVKHIAATVPQELCSNLNVVFFPQIGFLISLSTEYPTVQESYGGTPEDPWEKMFTSESSTYYKNSMMVEMDEEWGDLYGNICDRQIEILQNLAEQILEHEHLLVTCSDLCGEIDCLVALARGANQYNLKRPRMTEQNIISIQGGRHPLQELIVPAFVPNDTFMMGGHGLDSSAAGNTAALGSRQNTQTHGTDGPNMIILTGPNYSGKSIYLKQVAIIVYMAHVGSFVPADSATIGLTDKIMTRIATRESVSRMQSAFMIDLQQASIALSLATRRSLLIIDEFGKGTESYDGAGLAAGVFEHLLKRGPGCPKVLGATHFHEIFEAGFLKPRAALSFAHMEVRIDEEESAPEDQITYLYNYRLGRSISSLGTYCAAMSGIPKEVVSRAEQLIELAAQGQDLVEICTELSPSELVELADAVSSIACPLNGTNRPQERIAREFINVENFNNPRRLLDDLLAVVSPSATTSTSEKS